MSGVDEYEDWSVTAEVVAELAGGAWGAPPAAARAASNRSFTTFRE